VVASSSHLKPGEEGKIVAKIYIKGKIGFISKTVNVLTNDPRKPTVNLVLKALIKVQSVPPTKPAPLPQPSSSQSTLTSQPQSQPASQ
jgi:hypothetical protein